MKALVLQHDETAPAGLLGEWLAERRIRYDLHRTDLDWTPPSPRAYAFVATLGSSRSARDVHDRAVAAHLAFLRDAVRANVAVLGMCYGAQSLATVLGGGVERALEPEYGWREIATDAPELVPPGPWLAWHYERFVTPPGAVEIARTRAAPQAFGHGRHLALQFHPESTVDIVAQWAVRDAAQIATLGHDDPDALIAASPERVAGARAAAFALFDGFLSRSQPRGLTSSAARARRWTT